MSPLLQVAVILVALLGLAHSTWGSDTSSSGCFDERICQACSADKPSPDTRCGLHGTSPRSLGLVWLRCS